MVRPSRYIVAQMQGATMNFFVLRRGNASTIAVIIVSMLANYRHNHINKSIV